MTSGQLGAWSPFRIGLYRALWFANLGINLGSFTHITAAGWTMTLLTDSAVLVGAVQTVWAVPGFLLALHSGAIADEFDRRRVVAVSQGAALILAILLAALQWSGGLNPQLLLGFTLAESIALTVGTPAMISMTPQVVEPALLRQALALDSMTRNIAQMVGPALAGAAIAVFNVGSVYIMNAIALLWVVLLAGSGRLPVVVRGSRTRVNRSIIEGVKFVTAQVDLRNTLIRLLVANLLAASVVALLPLAAKNNLGMDAGGYGILYGAIGVGAVFVVVVLPTIRKALSEETLVWISSLVWAISIGGFGITTQSVLAAIFLMFSGAGMMAMMNVLFTSVLSRLEEWVRGRGTSMTIFAAWLGTSVGSITWGVIASTTSVSNALGLSALGMFVTTTIARATLPMFRAANS